nr:ribosome silencing factor [Marinicella rhabdoformis]
MQTVETAVTDAKAQNVKVLSVNHLTSVTDHLVICTGSSNRHMRHLAEEAIKALRDAGLEVLNTEGMDSSDWIIVDAGDAVLHVMSEEARGFYQLEGLWDIAATDEA